MAQSKDTASILKEIETIFNEAKQAPYHFTNIQKTLNEPVASLQELIKQEPLNYDAHYLMAQMMLYLDNKHVAINYLQICHNLNTDNHFLLQEIEDIKERIQQRAIDGLEYQFNRLEEDPNCIAAMSCLAQEYSTMGNLEEALNWRIRAIDTEPDNWELYYFASWTYKRLKQMDKCIDCLQKSLSLFNKPIDASNPESDMRPDLNKSIGEVYDDIKEYTTAESYYRIALELAHPDIKKHYYSELADNLKFQERYEEAITYYELLKATDIEKSYKSLDAVIGFCYYQMGDRITAKQYYQQCAIDNPADDITFFSLGVLNAEEGDDEMAKMMYEMALQANGNNIQAHYNLGSIAFREERYRLAVEHFLKVVELNIFSDTAYDMLYWSYSHLTEDEKAEEALMQSIIIKEIINKREEGE